MTKKAAAKKAAIPKKAAAKKAASISAIRRPSKPLSDFELQFMNAPGGPDDFEIETPEQEAERIQAGKDQVLQASKEFIEALKPQVVETMREIKAEGLFYTFAGNAMQALLPHHTQITDEVINSVTKCSWKIAQSMIDNMPGEE